jgi:ABC-type molybdate transport system ATPase subunit
MNQQHNFTQLKNILQTLVDTVENGISVDEPDLTDIKTNTADTANNTADILTNTGTIITNTSDTAANTADIITNTGTIITNTSNTAANTLVVANCVDTFNNRINATVLGVDLTAISTNTGVVSACVDQLNNRVNIDLNSINTNAIATDTGIASTGVQRVCIATNDINLAAINTNITSLSNCVDGLNNNLEIDTKAINGVTVASDIGIVNTGCQRITIATNDPVSVGVDGTYNLINGYNSGGFGMNVNIRGIQNAGGAGDIAVASGNITQGTQRMCIATDDVNLASITASMTNLNECIDDTNHHVEVDTNAINGVTMAVDAGNNSTGVQRVCISTDDVNLASIKSDIASILAILNDIWDNANNYIRTHETP